MMFSVPFNEAVVHQAVVRQLANARQGTACTKTRGEVAGSTGSSIARNIRVALVPAMSGHRCVAGGTMFGPKPRSYRQVCRRKCADWLSECALG